MSSTLAAASFPFSSSRASSGFFNLVSFYYCKLIWPKFFLPPSKRSCDGPAANVEATPHLPAHESNLFRIVTELLGADNLFTEQSIPASTVVHPGGTNKNDEDTLLLSKVLISQLHAAACKRPFI